jgi:hypothetical protein
LTKLKNKGFIQFTAVIIAVLFAHSAALAGVVPPFASVFSDSANVNPTHLLGVPDNTLQIECPEDISIFTDINECTAEISDNLNITVASGSLALLTWEMTGATEGASRRNGINQIESYVFNEGTTFIRYTARDNAGNVAECQFTVTVIDNEAPIISAPKNLTIKCDGRIPSAHTTLQAFLNAGGFATDNCNLLVSSFALISEVKDNRNCPYTLTRTYQISDEYGNVGIAKQHIFVLDKEGLISQMAISNSGATATISYTKSDVTCRNDNNGFVHLMINGTSGTLSYIWSSRDGDGIIQGEKDQNTLTDGDYNVKVYEDGVYLLELIVSILVADFESPAITCPADITLECGKNVPAAFSTMSQFENAGGKASDNCQLNYASFRMLSETKNRQICPYIITRTYQISDVNGNISKAEHFIFVNEGAETEPQQPLTLKSGMGIEASPATYSTPGTYTFTPPAGVTSVLVQAWGGGGGGGSSGSHNNQSRAGGGGGGGGFTSSNITVAYGTNYNVVVGAGGNGGVGGVGGTGGNSTFNSTAVIARGGSGGSRGGDGAGGAGAIAGTATGTGSVTRIGGNGAAGVNGTGSGGGGGGAGTTGNGGAASGTNFGTGTTVGGGNGGAGRTTGGIGNTGSTYGGGGSGGYKTGNQAETNGGTGAGGQVIISWSCPTYALTSAASATSICVSGTSTVTLTSTSLPDGTYTVTYNTTNPATSGNIATMIFNGNTGTFISRTLSATSTITVTALSSGTAPNDCSNAISAFNTVSVTVNPLPQGSLTANGPFCATGAGQLTWTATAGTGPFTIVYNDGTANRTANNVISGTPFATFTTPVTNTTTYTLVSVTGANGCVRTNGFTGVTATITVNPLPQGSLTANGPFCATGAGQLRWTATVGTGPYTIVYNDGTANRTAAGVTSGTPFAVVTTPVTSTTTYTLVSVTGANGCVRNSGFTAGSATITINPLPSANAGSAATICQGGTTLPLGGSIGGSATGGTWSTLAGGTFAPNANDYLNATWTPPAGFTGTATLILETTGGSCGSAFATKTITVIPNNTVSIASSTPTLCINTALTNITHTTTGATGIGAATGLPAGVTANWAGNTITISGTPTASGTFNYSIPLTGGCGAFNATGTINVTPNNTVSAASSTPTVCISTAIPNVTHTTTGATGIGAATGLPAGVTAAWATNTITISGTPTASGTFNYSIPLTGGCGAFNATGTINVTPNNTVSAASSTPTVCISTAIPNVTHTTTGATGIGAAAGLPAGVTAAWAASTITISGTPTASGTFNYTIPLTGGCGTVNATGTINVTQNNTVSAASSTPTVCISTAIPNVTHTTTGATGIGAATGLPAGVTAAWATNTITISGTPTASGTFNYSIPLTGGCGAFNATGTINVTPNNTVSAASSTPTVCISTAIPNVTHTTTGATGIGAAAGLPAGVTAAWAANTITISGTPTASGTFNYTIPLTGGCGTVNATGTITVTPENTASAPSTMPTVCINTSLTNITHTTTGATGIGASTGLPAGVTAAWAANTITISGTPTASGTFNYTIPLTGGCGTVNATGTINVTQNNTVSAASSTPTVCISTAIPNVTHTTTGATGIGAATGLPAGVTANWAGNTITISGTPTASGTFNYSIPLTGGCGTVNATGTITVTPENTASAPSTMPTVCINTAIPNVTHSTTGATGIVAATGLPAGVTANWAGNTITISGTPTASGTFNYSIPLTGGCGTVNATGTITVTPENTASAPSTTPTVCINTALTAITHTTTGVTGIGAVTGLPAGVTAAWAVNTITISGTPTVSGTFNYTIPLTGGCGTVNATGTINVIQNNTASAASSTPTVCISTAIPNVTHTTNGATGIGVATGLPAGVTAAWAANTITISGTPTESGTFIYTIPLTGGCGAVNATGTINVTPNNTVTAASSTPTVCINNAIPSVAHTTSGATGIGAAIGLPAGITASWAANTITISGTPTVSGTFNYSIPLTGGCGTVNATGTITVTPTVGTPTAITVSAGTEPTCQLTNGTTTTTYATTATNNTGFNWSLSNAAAGSIDASTGVMTWANGFTGTVDIRVTASGCNGPSAQVVRTVNVLPTVGTPTDPTPTATTICQGSGTTSYTTSAANATSYNWTVTGTGNTISGTGITGTVTWDPAFSGTATISVTANGCNGPSAPASTTVTVLPTPTATISGTTSVCQNTPSPNITFTNPMALPVTVTYNINGGANQTINIGAGSLATVAQPTGTVGDYVYNLVNVEYQSATACLVALTGSQTITVRPEAPVAPGAITGTTLVLPAVAETYTIAPVPNATTYTWTFPAGWTITAGQGTISVTVTTGTAGQIGDITVTAGNDCGTSLAGPPLAVTVDANLAIVTHPRSQSDCYYNTVLFEVGISGGGGSVTYTWQRNTGSGWADIVGDPDITYPASPVGSMLVKDIGSLTNPGGTQYRVVVSDGVITEISNPATLTVNRVLTMSPANVTTTICENGTATFSATTSGETPISMQWEKDGVPVPGATSTTININNATLANAGEYKLSVIFPITQPNNSPGNPSTCTTTSTISRVLVVNPLPVLSGPAEVCIGQTINWTADKTGTWISNNPSVATINATTGLVTGVSAGTVTFTFTENVTTTTCSATTPPVTVHPLPTGVIADNSAICSGQSTTFTVNLTGTAPWNITYTDGTTPVTVNGIAASPHTITVSPASSSTYTLTAVSDAHCNATSMTGSAVVTVYPLPTAVLSGNTTICIGSSANLSVALTGAQPWSITYTDGVTPVTVNGITSSPHLIPVSPSTTTTYSLTAVSDSHCTGTSFTGTATVTVDQLPTASAGGTQTVCVNGTATVSGASAANGTILWTEDGAGSITSGATTLTPVYTPAAGDAGNTITLTMTVTSNNTCSAAATATATYTVLVDPLPTATAGGSETICLNGTVTVSGAAASNGTILWTHNGAGTLAGANTLTPTYTAAAGDAGNTVTLLMTVTSNNACSSQTATATFSVIVNNPPQVDIPANQVVCDGTQTTAVNFTGTGTEYTWTNNNTSIGLAASGTGTIAAFTAVNSGTSPVLATITVTPVDNSAGLNCTGPSQSFTITVNPTAQVNQPADVVVCNGIATTLIGFSTTNTGGTTTYSWTNSDPTIGLAATGTGSIASFTAVNGSASPAVATITVTPHFTNGGQNCDGPAKTFTITVNPTPVAIATPSSQSICSGDATSITLTSNVPGTTFSWTVSQLPAGSITGASAGNGDAITQTITNTTASNATLTYTVTPANNGCTGTPVTVVITVKPKPVLSSSLTPAAICSGSTFNYTPTSSTTGTTFSWTRAAVAGNPASSGTGNISEVLSAAATFNATYIYTLTADGCTNTQNVTVTVSGFPTITVTPATPSICIGSGTTLTASGANTYTWSPAAGLSSTTGATVTANPVVTTTYTVTGTNTVGCTGTTTVEVIVHPKPTVTVSPDVTICNGSSTTLTAAGAVTYTWTPTTGLSPTSGPSVVASPTVTRTYTVTGTDANGCTNTATVTVNVNPRPAMTSAISRTICSGTTLSHLLTASLPSDFTWVAANNANVTGESTTVQTTNTISDVLINTTLVNQTVVYTVIPTSTADGCPGNPQTVSVVVNPSANAIISGTTSVCMNSTSPNITFTGSGGTRPYIFTYNIDGGTNLTVSTTASSNSVTVPVPTTTAGTFTYNLTNVTGSGTNPCPNAVTGSATVTVKPLPTATVAGDASVCRGGAAQVITFTGSGGTEPYRFVYKINGGANLTVNGSGATATVNAPATVAGTFVYTLVSVTDAAGTGCASTSVSGTATVVVNPLPVAAISGATEVCINSTEPVLTFTGSPGTGAFTFNYTINGGTVQTISSLTNIATVTVPTNTAGNFIYRITGVTDGNGCSNTINVLHTVRVNVLINATSAVTVPVPCPGGTATVRITATAGTSPYSYTFDGVTNGTGIFTGITAGTYNWSVSDASSCADFTGTLTVSDPIPVTFNAPIITDVTCPGGNNGRIVISATGGTGPYTYSISPAVGTQLPVGTFNGLTAQTYDITATDSKGCQATTSVTVVETPDVTPPTITCPPTVTVSTDAGVCVASGVNLGTPATSDNCAVASVTNNAPATFPIGITTVTWTVTDNSGNTATCNQTVTVVDTEAPVAADQPPIAAQCMLIITPPTGTDNCSGIVTATTTTTFPYSVGGTTTIVWTFTDAAGNVTIKNQQVTISDTEAPTWVTQPSSIVNLECGDDTTPAGPAGEPTAVDNCSVPTVTYSDNTVTSTGCPLNYDINRTWRATDASGNFVTWLQVIKVQDNTPPVINCTSYTNFDRKNLPLVDDVSGITVSDNCTSTGNIIVIPISEDYQFDNTIPGFCPTGLTRVYRAIDECGNSSECTQTYTFIADPDCNMCPGGVNTFQHIFSSPAETWEIEDVRRDGNCCGQSGNPPLRCAAYNFYLHKDAAGVIFRQDKGALPPADNFYMTLDECGQIVPLNSLVCLDGDRWHTVIFCKSGGNPNDFTIESVSGVVTLEDIVTRADEGCIKNIEVTGLEPGTIEWTVKFPTYPDADTLLNYLSCTNCANPVFTPNANTPPTIIYTVCGEVVGDYNCDPTTPLRDCADITVTTLPPIGVALDVDLTAICVGNIPEINAEVTPAVGDYTYEWFNGPNGTGTLVSTQPQYQPPDIGTYSVRVTEIGTGIGCNIATTNFNIAYDLEGPILLVPPGSPLVLECDDPNMGTTIANWLATAYASDENVSNIPVFNDYTLFTAECNLSVKVRFWADDICGNRTLDSAYIQITDTKDPVVITPAADGSSDCSFVDPSSDPGFLAWLAGNGGAVVTDGCDNNLVWTNDLATQTWTTDPASKDITITFRATDECGNFIETTATYSIVDNEPPAITCPDNVSETADLYNCSKTLVEVIDPTISDNCTPEDQLVLSYELTGATTTAAPVTGSASTVEFNVGVTTVIYTVTDLAGLSATCSFTVTIVDVTPPSLTIGVCTDATDYADANLCYKIPADIQDPTYTDACYPVNALTVTWTMTGATTRTGTGSVKGESFNVGVTTVTYTVTDPDNNSVSCDFTVTIIDVTPPVITMDACENVTDYVDPGNCFMIPLSLNDPDYSDTCWPNDALSLTWTMTGATIGAGNGSVKGLPFNVGITTVTYIITDPDNNVASCSFTVTVLRLDIPPAVIACPPVTPITALAEDGVCEAFVIVPPPVVTDPCSTITYTMVNSYNNTAVADDIYPVGTTDIVWTITDNSGGTYICNQTVIVTDNQSPVITTCPVTRNFDGCDIDAITGPVFSDVQTASTYAEFSDAVNQGVGSDNCDFTVSYIDVITSVSCPIVVTRTWTLTDASGNTTSCDQIININDDIPPVVDCPADIITPSDFDLPYKDYNLPVFNYSDNCTDVGDIEISWTLTGATTDSGTGIIPSPYRFNAGITNVTYIFADACGNETTCQFTIQVLTPPDITCIPDHTYYTDPNVCTHRLPTDANNPGVPVNNNGETLTWTWTIYNPDGSFGRTGTSTGAVALDIDQYDFQLGTSRIVWRAVNASGHAECEQLITVIDNQPPTFAANPYEDCVESLMSAVYTVGTNNIIYNPDYPNGDYKIYRTGSDIRLDIDPATYFDNCCTVFEPDSLSWTIDFDGTDPAEPSISGTGQPSTYSADIYLWGDGVNFQSRVHTITYRLTDCNGNPSLPVTTTITINPRPKLEKVN